jgi:hypothetical protein
LVVGSTRGLCCSDREALGAANPNLAEGLLDMEDMEVSMNQTAEVAFRRYRLNQWVRRMVTHPGYLLVLGNNAGQNTG